MSEDRMNVTEKEICERNKVWISGIIEGEFQYSNEMLKEKFYKTRVMVIRQSGTVDYVPIIVSELLLLGAINRSNKGKNVEISGQFRSHNTVDKKGKTHVEVYLFVENIDFYECQGECYDIADTNTISLEGYICKPPTYRTTSFGHEITDLMLAIARNNWKKDYIPCITWGKGARYARHLNVGDRLKVYGRVQSREYFKRVSPDSENGETKITYEVSILKIIKL